MSSYRYNHGRLPGVKVQRVARKSGITKVTRGIDDTQEIAK